jgi:ABC-2 type transport system permease protein
MSTLGVVTRFEFVRTLTKPAFWLRTLSIPVLLAAVLALSVFSNDAANKADESAKASQFSIMVTDEAGLIPPPVLTAAGVQMASGREAGVAAVKAGRVDAFFYYPVHPTKSPVEVYAKDAGLTNNGKYEAVATQLLQEGLAAGLGDGERVRLLQRAPATHLVTYKDGAEAKGFGRAVVPGLFLVLFYAVIVLMGNQMLTSTTEEKENRVIEMMLTSASARTIVVGKILSLFALGVIQIVAIVVPLAVAYFGFRSQLHIQQFDFNQLSFAPWPIITGAIIFVGGLMLFTGLLVAIGSAVPTAKEAGGFFAVAMILMLIPFYALGAVTATPDQLIVKVMTSFPLTAPITLMLRNAAGNLTLPEALISITILYISAIVMLGLAIRIFRFGSLEYSRKLGLREILTRRS